jgi:hypothetical protein
MGKNFPKLMILTKPTDPESLENKTPHTQIYHIQTANIKYKEAIEEGLQPAYRGTKIRITADFLIEIMQARKG